MPCDFAGRIWTESLAFFLSKLVNHRRKPDRFENIQKQWKKNNPAQNREILLLTLEQKMDNLLRLSNLDSKRRPFKAKQQASFFEAARLLGGLFGERLFGAFQSGSISLEQILKYLKKNVDDENFVSYYKSIMKNVEIKSNWLQEHEKKL